MTSARDFTRCVPLVAGRTLPTCDSSANSLVLGVCVSSPVEIPVGERLRFYRQAQGKKQVVVAGLAGITEDYLSQIERGLKTPTIGLLHHFGRILNVPVASLLGEPPLESNGRQRLDASAAYRALTAHDPGSAEAGDLEALRGRVNAAWTTWQTSPRRYTEISPGLPDLIADVRAAARATNAGTDAGSRREAHRLAADLYFLLRTYMKRIGRTDLALLVADRGVQAAEAADDPARIATAKWNLGHVLLAQDEAEGAEQVAAGAIEELQSSPPESAETAALAGALWLVAMVASVRNGDPWTARQRLRENAWPAARQAGEGNAFWTVFGPTNVALHAVSLEMETGEAADGLRLADDIDVSALPSIERQATFYLEVARCHEQRRDDAAVLLHLMNAENLASEELHYNILGRDLVRGLLKRARPTYAPQVRNLAERIALLD